VSIRTGLFVFLALLIADQVTKAAVLAHFVANPPVAVTSFFNLVLVWNRGVSFGMFSSAPHWGPLALMGITVVISIVLCLWLWKETRPIPRLAIWLILAGAMGNLIDRLRFGAVVDFLDFHVAGYHWPAFNIADSSIVIGAGLLLLDGLGRSRSSLEKAQENG
jgi:signal peptidase II